MATIGTLSDYLENKLLNHLLLNTPYTSPTSVYLALYTTYPRDDRTGAEVSGGGYARQALSLTVSGSIATNTTTITFPIATEDWGTVVAVAVKDALTSGNMLFWGKMDNQVDVNEGEVFSINTGMLNIVLEGNTKGGWGLDIAEQLLEHVLKNTTFTSPGENIYLALGHTLVVDSSYNFLSWTECTGTGYSRKKFTSWYSPTAGSTCNTSEVVFSAPPISADWGRITNIVIYDALTSGNSLLWGKLRAPIYIIAGDGLKFSAGNIDIRLD